MYVYVVKHGNDHDVDDALDGAYPTRADAFDAANDHHPSDVDLEQRNEDTWLAMWTPEEPSKAQTAYVDVKRMEVDASE